jgi:hypothetical protein
MRSCLTRRIAASISLLALVGAGLVLPGCLLDPQPEPPNSTNLGGPTASGGNETPADPSAGGSTASDPLDGDNVDPAAMGPGGEPPREVVPPPTAGAPDYLGPDAGADAGQDIWANADADAGVGTEW